MEDRFNKSIEANLDLAWELNKYLANNPEIQGNEVLASQRIKEILASKGIQVDLGYMDIPTAFYGKIGDHREGAYNIGILFEYDALPHLGHACGHSASAAISLLAALAIKENLDLIDSNIHLYGTPDEEDAGMKIPMAEAGAFDKLDMAIMVHMHAENRVNCNFLAEDVFEFTFKGHPAHAAESPWEGRNAFNGMTLMIHAFDMMRQSLRDGSRIGGFVQKAGDANNIIPDHVKCKYSFRAEKVGYLSNDMRKMIFDAAKGAAMATQTEVEIEKVGNSYFDLIELESSVGLMREVYEELGLEISSHRPYLGSSDIGNVSYRCPAIHPTISIGEDYKLHTVEFAQAMYSDKTKEAIKKASQVVISFINKLDKDKDLQEKIRKEFNEKRWLCQLIIP